jgi:hypothetical protein
MMVNAQSHYSVAALLIQRKVVSDSQYLFVSFPDRPPLSVPTEANCCELVFVLKTPRRG